MSGFSSAAIRMLRTATLPGLMLVAVVATDTASAGATAGGTGGGCDAGIWSIDGTGRRLLTVEEIDAYRRDVLAAYPDAQKKVYDVTRGATVMKVISAADDGGDIAFVRAGYQDGDAVTVTEYFMAEGHVVLLRELITAALTTTENRFYYARCNALEAMSRQTVSGIDPDVAFFGDYDAEAGDQRLDYATVQRSADALIAGR